MTDEQKEQMHSLECQWHQAVNAGDDDKAAEIACRWMALRELEKEKDGGRRP